MSNWQRAYRVPEKFVKKGRRAIVPIPKPPVTLTVSFTRIITIRRGSTSWLDALAIHDESVYYATFPKTKRSRYILTYVHRKPKIITKPFVTHVMSQYGIDVI